MSEYFIVLFTRNNKNWYLINVVQLSQKYRLSIVNHENTVNQGLDQILNLMWDSF